MLVLSEEKNTYFFLPLILKTWESQEVKNNEEGKVCKHPLPSLRSVGCVFRHCVTHKISSITSNFKVLGLLSSLVFDPCKHGSSLLRLGIVCKQSLPSA